MMSRNCLRILDGAFLVVVYVVQSVILSLFTVYTKASADIPNSYVNPVAQKIIWLVVDLIVLVGFILACLVGFKHLNLSRQREKSSEARSRNGIEILGEGDGDLKQRNVTTEESGAGNFKDDEENDETSCKSVFMRYLLSDKVPLSYMSWFLYASVLIIKMTIIFTSNWVEKFGINLGESDDWKDSGIGPEMLVLGIALAGIIFSLLVEAHNNKRADDAKRCAYLNHISYTVALEVLDTTDLVSVLIPSQEEIAVVAGTGTEFSLKYIIPTIIILSAINLLLPCVTLYKLSASSFGELYHVRLEMIYNTLHFLFVSIPFFSMRVYLWAIHGHKDVLFLIKNAYGILGFFRGLYANAELYKDLQRKALSNQIKNDRRVTNGNRRNKKDVAGASNEDNAIEMHKLM